LGDGLSLLWLREYWKNKHKISYVFSALAFLKSHSNTLRPDYNKNLFIANQNAMNVPPA
jgi:hypothetical protein